MVDEMEDFIAGHRGEKTRRWKTISIRCRGRSDGLGVDQRRWRQRYGRRGRRESLNSIREGLEGF